MSDFLVSKLFQLVIESEVHILSLFVTQITKFILNLKS